MTDHPAAIAERARVVEFLREQALMGHDRAEDYEPKSFWHMQFQAGAIALNTFADAIDRRDHVVQHITQSGGRGDGC